MYYAKKLAHKREDVEKIRKKLVLQGYQLVSKNNKYVCTYPKKEEEPLQIIWGSAYVLKDFYVNLRVTHRDGCHLIKVSLIPRFFSPVLLLFVGSAIVSVLAIIISTALMIIYGEKTVSLMMILYLISNSFMIYHPIKFFMKIRNAHEKRIDALISDI
ncbi:MAG: hypothetical protein ACLKAK_04750 [Alkaliphilus sp.]